MTEVEPIEAFLERGRQTLLADLRRKKPREARAAASKPRGNPERDAQRAVVAWLRKAGCIVSATFTEQAARETDKAKRARFGAARKATGATTGFPDLTVITPSGAVFFIEMKAAKGVLSDAQRAMHADLAARGRAVILGRDIWSVQEGMKAAGITLAPLPGLRMAVPVQPLVVGP